ncbi:MAG: SMI1/KNR4 family protein [Acidovorax sp.]|jgi:hypothetical protein|nr:SMI1/KNR4 family protein [Acidovorax sp.]
MSALADYQQLSVETGIALPVLLRDFLASGLTVYGPDWASTWRQRYLQQPPLLLSFWDFEWLPAQESRAVIQEWLNPAAQQGQRFLPFAQTGAGDAWCLVPMEGGKVGVALVWHDAAESRLGYQCFADFVYAGFLNTFADLSHGPEDFSPAQIQQSLQADVAQATRYMEEEPAAYLQACSRRLLVQRAFKDGPRAQSRQVASLLSQHELEMALQKLVVPKMTFPVLARWEIASEEAPSAAPDWRSYAQLPGQKIAAIKAYQHTYGVSLSEAKAAVDHYIADLQHPLN